jgi:hypothetical protein
MMHNPLQPFKFNLMAVRGLVKVYEQLATEKPADDFTDLLRAAIVQLLSTLDLYVHDVIRNGMVEIFTGNRPETQAYHRFAVSLGTLHRLMDAPHNEQARVFEVEIAEKISRYTYQSAKRIAEGLEFITEDNVWRSVSKTMGRDIGTIRQQLDLLSDRRNQIVHEADTDPISRTKHKIQPREVHAAIDFIEKFGEALQKATR